MLQLKLKSIVYKKILELPDFTKKKKPNLTNSHDSISCALNSNEDYIAKELFEFQYEEQSCSCIRSPRKLKQ